MVINVGHFLVYNFTWFTTGTIEVALPHKIYHFRDPFLVGVICRGTKNSNAAATAPRPFRGVEQTRKQSLENNEWKRQGKTCL